MIGAVGTEGLGCTLVLVATAARMEEEEKEEEEGEMRDRGRIEGPEIHRLGSHKYRVPPDGERERLRFTSNFLRLG